jgi:hypothetical protein
MAWKAARERRDRERAGVHRLIASTRKESGRAYREFSRPEHLSASAKYSFNSLPESSTRFGRTGARDEHGHIRAIQNAAR